ncbi:MAG TPA: hypothetical protein VG326_13580 [Tepidisphaeraceae bacterium]|jgi:hypothetical protein|nr:hypothetical protein [Tepidisphaeraceae bacterium]
MRALFGLVSLLVCALIVAYVWSTYTVKTADVGTGLHDQAEQISGRSADGIPVADSIKTEEALDGRGFFKGLLVTDVTPGGGMQTMYGLQKDDVIITVESLTTNELTSADAMRPFLVEAYRRSEPLGVIRNGERISLPLPSPTTAPASSPGGSIQNQLNGILKQSRR